MVTINNVTETVPVSAVYPLTCLSTSSTSYKHTECETVLMAFLIPPQINETFSPPNDKCVTYTCQDVNGDPMVKESKKTCPAFNPENCVPVSFLSPKLVLMEMKRTLTSNLYHEI